MNPQNITNPDRCQDPDQRELAYMVRSCIVPKKGHVFVTVDAAQIEARITAWQTRQESLLTDFREGGDPYSSFISEIVNEPVYKPTKDTEPDLVKRLIAFRNVGKEAILGLGFQMGHYRFFDRLKSHPEANTIRKVLGDRLTEVEPDGTNLFSKEIVMSYRKKYSMIPIGWNNLNTAFHKARKSGEHKVGKVTFCNITKPDKGVALYLPSGRIIRYYNIKQITDKKGRKNWIHGNERKIFGGLLMENCAQGIARDILCEAVLKLEAEGYPVVLTTHDDLKMQVVECKSQQCLDRAIEVISTPPGWAHGLPLNAEGKISYDFN